MRRLKRQWITTQIHTSMNQKAATTTNMSKPKVKKKYSKCLMTLALCTGLSYKEVSELHMSDLSALWIELGLPKTYVYFYSKDGILDKKPFWTLGTYE